MLAFLGADFYAENRKNNFVENPDQLCRKAVCPIGRRSGFPCGALPVERHAQYIFLVKNVNKLSTGGAWHYF